MSIVPLSTASGAQLQTESSISWELHATGPVISGGILLAFVGAIDSQKPEVASAVFSGSALTPFAGRTMDTVASITGPGGSSFPCGYVFSLANPITITGTVTGTVDITFDETVTIMDGMSAIFVGGSGILDGVAVSTTINTDVPNFAINTNYTTTASGSVVVDMCISESSNHNDHLLGSGQELLGNLFFSGPRLTASYSGVATPGAIEMGRSQAGGPFAGATLIAFALKDNS